MEEKNNQLVYAYVEKFKAGMKDSFDRIYELYKDSVYYFALTIVKNTVDAEEVVQETFVKVYRKIDTLKDISKFHSWVFTIAYNTAIDMKNNKQSDLVSIEEHPYVENEYVSQDEIIDNFNSNDIREVVIEELKQLPDKLFITGKLYYCDDLTIKEISEVLQTPTGTIKNRLNRIRAKIKPKLEKRGYSPQKYFSFTAVPILIEAFAFLQSQHKLDPVVSAQILEQTKTLQVTESIEHRFPTKTVFGGSLLAVVFGIVLANQSMNVPPNITIDKITYSQEYTNTPIEVEAKLNGVPSEQYIDVFYEDEPIVFELDGEHIHFTAKENGCYTIKTPTESKDFQIKQIDLIPPEMVSATYDGKSLHIEVRDEDSGVDYNNSYLVYQDETYNILHLDSMEDMRGTFKVCIEDVAKNTSEYEITIDEILVKD